MHDCRLVASGCLGVQPLTKALWGSGELVNSDRTPEAPHTAGYLIARPLYPVLKAQFWGGPIFFLPSFSKEHPACSPWRGGMT